MGFVIGAIVVRAFLVMGLIVPVTVDGSSMAPVLNGPQVVAVCSNCGEVTSVDASTTPPAQVICFGCSSFVQTETQPILSGDTMWIDRTAFHLRPPQRWEVVVFQCPNDATQLCVKRVLGLPGERIAFREDNLYVNDTVIPKPLAIEYKIRPGDGVNHEKFDKRQQYWQLGEGYFVVGDNQAVSLDSRNWPASADLPPRLIVGRPIRSL